MLPLFTPSTSTPSKHHRRTASQPYLGVLPGAFLYARCSRCKQSASVTIFGCRAGSRLPGAPTLLLTLYQINRSASIDSRPWNLHTDTHHIYRHTHTHTFYTHRSVDSRQWVALQGQTDHKGTPQVRVLRRILF